MTPVIGVSIAPPSTGIGVTLTRAGEVLEAVTLLPARVSRRAFVEQGLRAVQTGRDLLAKHVLVGTPLWVVEDLADPDDPGQQPSRAASRRGDARASDQARAVALGALLAALPHTEPVLVVPPIGPVDPADCPEVLSGTKPRDWMGGKGQRREPQRTGWACAERGHALLHPRDAREHVRALDAVVDACVPFGEEALLAACEMALALVKSPPGSPALTPVQLAAFIADRSQ